MNRRIVQVLSFGAVVALLASGVALQWSWAWLLVFLAGTAIIGGVFCGWICPVGFLQDMASGIGRALGIDQKAYAKEASTMKVLPWLRYGVLAWLVWSVLFASTAAIQMLDPFLSVYQLASISEFTAFGGLAILGIGLVGSMFTERFMCKYGCPYGAGLGLLNTVQVVGIQRQASSCIGCNKCNKVCPMGVNVAKSGSSGVRDVRCISCGECVQDGVCPVPGTLSYTARTPRLKNSTLVWGACLALVMGVGLLVGFGSSAGAATCPATGCTSSSCHATSGLLTTSESTSVASSTTEAVQSCPATGCTASTCHATQGLSAQEAYSSTELSASGTASNSTTVNSTTDSTTTNSTSDSSTVLTCPRTGCTASSCHATSGGGGGNGWH